MGLQDDWKELKGAWGNLSALGKVVSVTSFAGSVLSIASIGDSVYAFRGFIGNTLDYYRTIFEPFRGALEAAMACEISELTADLLVADVLVTGSLLRAFTIFGGRAESGPSLAAGQCIGVAACGLLVGTGILASASGVLEVWGYVISFVNAFVLIILCFFPENEVGSGVSRVARLSGTYVCFIVLSVAILAAISEGLTRVA